MDAVAIAYRPSSADPAMPLRGAVLALSHCVGNTVLEATTCDDVVQIHTQADERLSDLGTDACQHYLCAEQPYRLRRTDQAACHLCIDHRHTGNIDNRYARP